MSTSVVVTGASGYIGKHVVKEFLDHGYAVRATVRSDAKEAELREAIGADGADRLSVVRLDLNSDEGWDAALEGVDALIHTASPFPLATPNDPDELIRPAVDGTLRALRAAEAAGVRRAVLTSSCVAIYNDELRDGQTILDETNWSPTRQPFTTPYDDSKTLAERAAWEHVGAAGTALSTVNPGVVLGEPLDDNFGSSLSLVEQLLGGEFPMLPDVNLPVVHVRDVAAMHRLALESDEAIGQRFPAVAGALSMVEMAEILNAEIPTSAAKVRRAPSFLIRLMARFNADMKSIAPRLGKSGAVSGANAERRLGMTFTSARDAVIESGRFLATRS
ncbi:MAG: SDR family NAD(P)-dependent oxidoreductase [Actinomycetota bacterium]